MRQILMIITAEGCREFILSETASSFCFFTAQQGRQAERISLYQKEGVWSFCGNVKGFLKPTSGNAGTSFCVGEQKIWEYTDKYGKQMVFLTFGKKEKETEFQYYIAGEKEEITIGKSVENTISYDCMGLVSNLHAEAKWRDGTWELCDKSKNGIFFDGKRILGQKKMQYGDYIEIFGLKIVFLGRIIGVEAREHVHVQMDKQYWQEPEDSVQGECALCDGVQMVETVEWKRLETENRKNPVVVLSGKEKKDRERREDPTLFFAVGPIKLVYDGKKKKKQRAYEKEEFLRWKLEQREKIVDAYECERNNWLQQNVWDLFASVHWKEEIWRQPKRNTMWITWGMGNRRTEIVYDMKQVADGREREELEKMVEFYQWQEQVPVGMDLLGCRQLEIVGENAWKFLKGLLMQLVATIPYTKLRIVCLAKKENPVAHAIRWLPHVWSKDQDYRYYATDREMICTLFSRLEKEKDDRHTLVLVEERTWLSEIDWQYRCEKDGYSFWFLVDNLKKCSRMCGQRLMVWKNSATFFQKERMEQEFVPYYLEEEQWKEWLRRISSLRIGKFQNTVQGQVELFQLYTKEKREKKAVIGRWEKNQTRKGICACLGLDEKENPVFLDIQETQHGPHGLIAGTTGAGKSIALQTFVLSLAMEYSPKQLEFVLIDYKGGDMASPLSRLPHVVGTLTNLQPQILKRGLDAIQSEIERRQKLLAETQLSHVDIYNQQMERMGGKVVPHLCVVVDEFAELTTDAPYFLEGLLKVSRVGRSLGIHLILATQKPSGTVTEHIWANSKFHLCFMVQSKEDSMEMLHREDAAKITSPGEAFLQVGTKQTLTKIRVAHAGALAKTKSCVTRILDDGTKVEVQKEETLPTQREKLVCLLSECAREIGIETKHKLWMPLLQSKILRTKIQEWQENVMCLGWCDVPKKQIQMPLLIEEKQFGNIAVLGEVGRGKTTCLRTILWELGHNRFERKVWIFLCDFNGEFKKEKHGLPWSGAIIKTAMEFEKFMYFLVEEYEKRRENSQKQYPMLWVCIDHMEAMREQTGDWHIEEIVMLVREGKKYGIYFVFLAQSYGLYGIPSVWKSNIDQQLVFSEGNREKSNCYPQAELPECTGHCPGRGITKMEETVVEFQGLYVEPTEFESWFQSGSVEALETPFVFLPEILDYDIFVKMEQRCRMDNKISIGCNELDGSVCQLPLERMEYFFVVGKQYADYEIPLCTFLMELKRKQISCLFLGKEQSASTQFAQSKGISVITETKWEKEKINTKEYSWVFVEDLLSWLGTDEDWLLERMDESKNTTWVVTCQSNEFRMLRKYSVFQVMIERQQGIYVGSGIREQSFFNTGILSKSWENYMEQQDIGLLFLQKKKLLLHFPRVHV